MKNIPIKLPGKLASTRALVDDEDYEKIAVYRWYLHKGYASRNLTKNSKTSIRLMHRLVASAPQGMTVDHINCNKLDNRKGNLRICTFSENIRNRPANIRSKTGVKGVRKIGNKFSASIRHGGRGAKPKHLGMFDTIEAASRAYAETAKIYYGEFARW